MDWKEPIVFSYFVCFKVAYFSLLVERRFFFVVSTFDLFIVLLPFGKNTAQSTLTLKSGIFSSPPNKNTKKRVDR